MDNIYACASPASSVVYGNVAQSIKAFIMENFPKNFFKYDTITSEIAYRNIRRQLLRNSNGKNNVEMTRRLKPELIIRPSFDVPNDGFLYDIPLLKNYDNLKSSSDMRAMKSIFVDRDNKFNFLFRYNRDKIDFDITINVDNQIQQIDLYKRLLNQFKWNSPFFIDASLESILPFTITQWIGYLSNTIHETDCRNNIRLLKYMNQHSNFPITYKVKNSATKEEFFMYYNTKLLTTFTNLDKEAGSRKNQVEDIYPISFRMTVEFNLPGMFYVCGIQDNPKAIDIGIKVKNQENNYVDFIPLFTESNLFNKYETNDGFKLYRNALFELESINDHNILMQDLFDMSDKSDKVTYSYFKSELSNDNPYHTYFRFVILNKGDSLVEGVDYSFDVDKMLIYINNPVTTDRYRVLIYINNIKVMEDIVNLINNEKNELPKLT